MILASNLQTKGVFAVNCKIYPDKIICGILLVESNQGQISLLNPETEDRYVVAPVRHGFYTTYTLERIQEQG